MAHETALRIHKASFQSGKTTLRSNKNLRKDGTLKGNYIVGMEGLDTTFTTQPGWSIRTETTMVNGYPALRVYTVKEEAI